MKKITALVLLMLVAAMALSACSSKTTTTTTATEVPAATAVPATEAPVVLPEATDGMTSTTAEETTIGEPSMDTTTDISATDANTAG